MCEALHELWADDLEKVTKEVTHNDILLFVEILLEDGYGESTVCEKLHQKFHIQKADIQDYIRQVQGKNACLQTGL